jgi:hypothetical protein
VQIPRPRSCCYSCLLCLFRSPVRWVFPGEHTAQPGIVTNQLLCQAELRQRAVDCGGAHPTYLKYCQRGGNRGIQALDLRVNGDRDGDI